jgi:FlaG/FlaF family flagellin (archaellin)
MIKFRGYKKNNSAVSEVLGTVLILAISVVILASVYLAAFSLPAPSRAPVVNAVGMTANDQDIIISHQGGDDLSLDAILVLTVGGKDITYKIEDLMDPEDVEDGFWNIGEELVFSHDIRQLQVEVRIIDPDSDSVVMMGVLQEGMLLRDPYVFTLNATDITANSAKLIMGHNFWEKSGEVRFAYRVVSGAWSYTPWISQSGEANFETVVNGLTYNTQY